METPSSPKRLALNKLSVSWAGWELKASLSNYCFSEVEAVVACGLGTPSAASSSEAAPKARLVEEVLLTTEEDGRVKRYNGLYHYNAHRTVYMGTYNEEQPIPSMCHLQIVQTEEETVIVATELVTNMGMSITNAWEWLATCIVREYELDPQRTRFIEHYGPASDRDASRPDTYDEVLFTWSGTDAEQPQWRRLQGAELAALHAITAEGLRQDDNLPYLGL